MAAQWLEKIRRPTVEASGRVQGVVGDYGRHRYEMGENFNFY